VAFVAAGLFPWALPLLRAYLPLGAFGIAADAIFATMCHRLPERSLVIAGVAMPLCSRCAGVFSGAAVGALAAWPRISARGHRLLITAAGAAMLLDVVTQDLGVHPVWHATRLATGFLFGYAVGAAALVALLRAHGDG
jgi:uncharacterized membrane protein